MIKINLLGLAVIAWIMLIVMKVHGSLALGWFAILTFPFWFPVLFFFGIVFLSLFIIIFMGIIGCAVIMISLIVLGFFNIFDGD
jgi:hypothetical protein